MPVAHGEAAVSGDFELAGVAGRGARIALDFVDPGGAGTGRLLSTGRVRDVDVMAAARDSGLMKLRRAPGQILDDHVPLQEAGLPCLHLIGDFMNMPYWHQPGDTMEVIDADALKKVGRTTLRFLSSVAP